LTLDHRRFAQISLWIGFDGPFFEDSLVGRRARIGDVLEVMVVKNDARCNVDYARSDTAAASPEVLQTVAKHHASCAGCTAPCSARESSSGGDRFL